MSSCSSASVAHPTARSVSFARGGEQLGCRSLNVATGHDGSGQRQIRLRHRTRTGVPKLGASAASCTRRPCPTATTPQLGQPATSASVSTVSTSRQVSLSTSRTCMPGTSNRASARVHQRPHGPPYSRSTSRPSLIVLLGRFDPEGLDLLTPGTPRRLLGAAQELLHLCVDPKRRPSCRRPPPAIAAPGSLGPRHARRHRPVRALPEANRGTVVDNLRLDPRHHGRRARPVPMRLSREGSTVKRRAECWASAPWS